MPRSSLSLSARPPSPSSSSSSPHPAFLAASPLSLRLTRSGRMFGRSTELSRSMPSPWRGEREIGGGERESERERERER
eukprot:3472894-Rhodomonas_salina.1